MMLLALNAVAQTERFCIAKEGKSATILVDEDDWKGVIRAANDLGDDDNVSGKFRSSWLRFLPFRSLKELKQA